MIIAGIDIDPVNLNQDDFKIAILYFLESKNPPENEIFHSIIKLLNDQFDTNFQKNRPSDITGRPGGIVYMKNQSDIIVLPDLHARRNFLKSVLFDKISDDAPPLIDTLYQGNSGLLCLGDGVHSEGVYSKRWKDAADEFMNGFTTHRIMDSEIADSFNLMIAVALLQLRFPESFCFIKGNHENILNENNNGNYSFAKYSYEGEMVASYFKKFYSSELLAEYAVFERNLPLFVVGNNFMASHAEPLNSFDLDTIINYRYKGELIESLTWTDNHRSHKGTIKQIISNFYTGDPSLITYFGGHRSIRTLYNRVNDENFIQIHNPNKQIVVRFNNSPEVQIDPDTSVTELINNNISINNNLMPDNSKGSLIENLNFYASTITGFLFKKK